VYQTVITKNPIVTDQTPIKLIITDQKAVTVNTELFSTPKEMADQANTGM